MAHEDLSRQIHTILADAVSDEPALAGGRIEIVGLSIGVSIEKLVIALPAIAQPVTPSERRRLRTKQ